MKEEISIELKLPLRKELNNKAKIVRPALVNQSISYPKGDTIKWRDGVYSVGFLKPGKEADLNSLNHHPDCTCNLHDSNNQGGNINDMKPVILEHGEIKDAPPRFTDIFEEIQIIYDIDKDALELIGCLIFRNAFTLDHQLEKQEWEYNIPKNVLYEVTKRLRGRYKVQSLYKSNVATFLHYIDAIATNEDVKYYTLGYNNVMKAGGTGRRNNLLTIVNLIAVLLRKVSIASFAGSFARPPSGISPFTYTKTDFSDLISLVKE